MANKMCPRLSTGKKRFACIEHDCKFWIKLTNTTVDGKTEVWDCADAWGPVLQCEIIAKTSQLGAAIESFRNEMVKANQAANIMATTMRLQKDNADESAN